jgi:bacillithiol biosynthesis cysteine-adding enzyme BshC
MRIEWEEQVPVESWLPKRHPLRGLLRGDERLAASRHAFFSSSVTALPPSRTMDPGLVRRLEERHRDLGAPDESLHSLQLLADGAAAVVTGQQAGLLGGPFLTVIKALTAIRLAGELARSTGRPHVPVFWAETDDHDVEEANRVVTLRPDSEPVTFELPWPESHREGPTGSLPLGPEAGKLIDDFLAATGETEFTGALRERLRSDLEGSRNFSQWFARGMLSLLGKRGLVVFDALEGRYKEFARDLWVRVLEEPLRLTAELEGAGERLGDAGYTPVLAKKRRRCPFFLVTEGRREAVFFERGSFRAEETVYTHLELRRRLDERPGDFSAGVNLRPLLQDYLLPTAVFVGGPTELAYFEQVLPGYAWAGVVPPSLVLRPGLSLVEPSVRRILRRQKIDPAELKPGVDGVLGSVIRRENRLADPARWEKLRQSALRPLERFADGLGPEEAEVAELARRAGGKVDFTLKELEKKTVATLRRRSEVLRNQLVKSRNRLFPLGRPQERILSPCYFLNKYGPELIDSLERDLPADFTRHHFGTIIP